MKFDKSKKKIIIVICGFSILTILSIYLIPPKTIQIKADNSVIRNYQSTQPTENAPERIYPPLWSPCGLAMVYSPLCLQDAPEANFEPNSVILEVSSYSEIDSCHYPTKGGCLTASGKIAKAGMAASNLYPFGTRLEIDGQIYTVEDKISKRYNNRIDIWVGMGQEAYEMAIQKGVQKKQVKIINE